MEPTIDIPLDKLEPDPNQPRKAFNEQKLQELAVSIGAHGVEQAIKVRPHPVAKKRDAGHYMIIFGERRWRAAGIAGLAVMPATVDDHHNTDVEILERQLVENAQRDDIHPLEEGEAYQALHKKHGVSIEDLIAKTGKSRSHIYSRMKLTELAAGVKKAMLDGRLPHAHGELIGRIPDKKLQEQCCAEVLGDLKDKDFDELQRIGVDHESINPKQERYGNADAQPLSFRATAVLVRRRYQTKLSLATFDPSDETLTKAGACGPCEYRSGNQPELPGMGATKDDDHCGNLVCFEAKSDAQWKRTAAAAGAAGVEIIDGKKAEKLFWANGEPKDDSGYVSPKQRLPYDLTHRYDDELNFKKVLGKHVAEVPKALVRINGGAPIELLDRKAALKVITEHGLIPKKKQAPTTPSEKKRREEKAEDKAATKLRTAAFAVLTTDAIAAVSKDWPASKEASLWRFVAMAVAAHLHWEPHQAWAARRGTNEIEAHEEIEQLIEKAKTAAELRALTVELLFAANASHIIDDFGDADEMMALAVKLFGLDWKRAEAAVRAEAESLAESERAAKEAAAAKPAPAKKKAGAK